MKTATINKYGLNKRYKFRLQKKGWKFKLQKRRLFFKSIKEFSRNVLCFKALTFMAVDKSFMKVYVQLNKLRLQR